jgi:hypothetical protein
MKGSHMLNDEFFKTHSMKKEKSGPVQDDWHGLDDDEVAWSEEWGGEAVKVEVDARNLIVWDSRTVHYNVLPDGNNTRAVICKFATWSLGKILMKNEMRPTRLQHSQVRKSWQKKTSKRKQNWQWPIL